MKDVIIIGAGIAGLTAAHELHKEKLDFQLLEPSYRVGGVIETLELNGNLIEAGPHTFSSFSADVLGIVKDLGIQDELIEANPTAKKRYVCLNGNLMPVPANPQEFLKSELLTKDAKWTLLEEFVLPPVSREESVEDFISRRFGREVLKGLVQPYLNGVFAGDVKKLSANAVFPKLKELESKHKSVGLGLLLSSIENILKARKPLTLHSFKKGMEFLPNSIYEEVKNKVTLSVKDIEITRAKDFFIVTFKANNKTINYTTNSILFAIPANRMNEYGYLFPDEYLSDFKSIEYAPVATVTQLVDKSNIKTSLDGFGFLCTYEVQKKLLGTIWTSSIFPDRGKDDKAILTSFIGGAHFKKISELKEEEISNIVSRELADVLNISNPELLKTIYIRVYEHAIPQYNMGHLDTVKRIEKLMDTKYGVFFAGNYLRGISINDTVKSSKSAVGRIKDFLKTVIKEEALVK
jgi:oxygen-dependent protoporphyrinogen oxidase